jgi:hypothetical protein
MKRQIRQGVFETNSSSTHSITITEKSLYESWKNGNVMYCNYQEKKFIPVDEAIEHNLNTIQEDYLDGAPFSESFIKKYKETKNLRDSIDEFTDELGLESGDIEYYDMYQSYDEYWEYIGDRYETYTSSYTTQHGDNVVAFGYYGNDY